MVIAWFARKPKRAPLLKRPAEPVRVRRIRRQLPEVDSVVERPRGHGDESAEANDGAGRKRP